MCADLFPEFVSLHGFLNLVCVHPLFFIIMQMLICCTCNWIELSVFFLDKGMQVSVYGKYLYSSLLCYLQLLLWRFLCNFIDLLFIIVISCGELSCWVPQVQTSFSNVSRYVMTSNLWRWILYGQWSRSSCFLTRVRFIDVDGCRDRGFLALNEVYQVRLSDPILLHSMML